MEIRLEMPASYDVNE